MSGRDVVTLQQVTVPAFVKSTINQGIMVKLMDLNRVRQEFCPLSLTTRICFLTLEGLIHEESEHLLVCTRFFGNGL
jgi:hypothetical protein